MRAHDPASACDRLIAIFERTVPLERRGRSAADDTIRVPVLEFAIAQLKMRIRPALEPGWIGIDPVHVSLFGGTNTGKSTVLNLILGRDGARMGVTARFSQHPEAYRHVAAGDRWLDRAATRFAGYRRYRDEHPPRQSDEELRRDGYRPALALLDPDRLATPAVAPAVAAAAVLWDAPDFSTEEAGIYMGAVIDLLALADLVIMTVTDESYADDRGTALLRMVGETGASILVVANKLPDNPSLVDDVARTLDSAGRSRGPVVRLPEVAGASIAERLENLLGCPEAAILRGAVERETARGAGLKRAALAGALEFLARHLDEILKPLSDEEGVARGWGRTVERLTRELILDPYRRDYLEGVRYGEFNRTLIHLLELLQVPWIGPFLTLTGRLVRAPLRLAHRGARRLLGLHDGDAPRAPEEEVLRDAIGAWLAALKGEAQVSARAAPGPAWTGVVAALEGAGFRQELDERFARAFAAYREQVDAEARRRAEALFRKLQEKPARLAALRAANLLVSAASVALVIKTAGLDWSDAVLGPVVAGLWQNLLGWGLGRYLETLRSELQAVQLRAVGTLIETQLEQPARELFQGSVRPGDLEAARADFALVRETAGGHAREGRGADDGRTDPA